MEEGERMSERQIGTLSQSVRFRQLQKMFIGAAVDDVAELDRLLADCDTAAPDGDAGARFRKLAHDLRGTGGGYEFPAISDTAATVEEAFLTHSSAQVLRESLELLKQAVADAKSIVEKADSSESSNV